MSEKKIIGSFYCKKINTIEIFVIVILKLSFINLYAVLNWLDMLFDY